MIESDIYGGKLQLKEQRLCLDFANTANWHASEQPVEELTSYADLVGWGRQVGLLTAAEAERLGEKQACEHYVDERPDHRHHALYLAMPPQRKQNRSQGKGPDHRPSGRHRGCAHSSRPPSKASRSSSLIDWYVFLTRVNANAKRAKLITMADDVKARVDALWPKLGL